MEMEQKNQLNQLASDSFAQDTKGLYLECAQAMPWRQASQDVFWEGAVSHVLSWVDQAQHETTVPKCTQGRLRL